MCSKPGLATQLLTVGCEHILATKEEAGADKKVEIVMCEGVPLTGRIQDEHGESIPGIRIWLNYGTFAETHAKTNERGEFVMEHCDLSSGRELLVDSRSWARKELSVGGEIGHGPLNIMLQPRRFRR